MPASKDDDAQNGNTLPTLSDKAAIAIDGTALINSDAAVKLAGTGVAILYLLSGGPIGPLGVITMVAAITALFVADVYPAAKELSLTAAGVVIPFIAASQTQVAISNADARLRGNIAKCTRISEQFKRWRDTQDPQEKEYARRVLQDDYNDLTRDYLPGLISDFTSDLFRGVLVPQYVQSAVMYLSLLVSYYHHGEALGIAPRGGFKTVQDYVLAQFRGDLKEITDTAMISYRRGLEQIVTKMPNYPRTWLDYNDYRNTVTRTGLDLLTGLVYLDPVRYPSSCSAKCWNRNLYTLLDTSYGNDNSLLTGDIVSLEARIAQPVPVGEMVLLEVSSGRFTHDANLRRRIDGFYRTSTVEVKSVDGFYHIDQRPSTGRTSEGATIENGSLHTNSFASHPCIRLGGHYWNGTKNEVVNIPPQGNVVEPYTHCLTTLGFRHLPDPDKTQSAFPAFNSPRSIQDESATNPFLHEFVPLQVDLPNNAWSLLQPYEQLNDVKVIDERNANLVHYAFVWSNLSTGLSLLPLNPHTNNPKEIPVEQFHAIKALASIREQDLTLIPGPGFTGGDLVEVKAGQGITFRLARGPDPTERWFNGKYNVRLWCINDSGGQVPVGVRVFPDDGNSLVSIVTTEIPVPGSRPNRNALNYSDLMSIDFTASVLISRAFSNFTLELRNTSLASSIIVDRIELIFDMVATA